MSDKWTCLTTRSTLEVEGQFNVVFVASYDKGGYTGVPLWLAPDDAIDLGKRLIELGEEVKRGV